MKFIAAELLNQRWSLSRHDRWRPTCEQHIYHRWKFAAEGGVNFFQKSLKTTDLVKPLIWLIHRDDPCIHGFWNPKISVGFHPRTSTKWLINNHAAQIGRNISPEIFSISLGILVGNFPLPTSKQPRQGGLNIFRGCKESVHVPKPSPPAQGGLSEIFR